MRLVLQRVDRASVSVEGEVRGQIGRGLMVLVGVGQGSTEDDARWLAGKTADLRVFSDEQGRMNRSLRDVGGAVLAISQFTLYGDARKGRRPSFVEAAEPAAGDDLYRAYCDGLAATGVPVQRGVFGAHMDIDMVCDGPVTILLQRTAGRTDG